MAGIETAAVVRIDYTDILGTETQKELHVYKAIVQVVPGMHHIAGWSDSDELTPEEINAIVQLRQHIDPQRTCSALPGVGVGIGMNCKCAVFLVNPENGDMRLTIHALRRLLQPDPGLKAMRIWQRPLLYINRNFNRTQFKLEAEAVAGLYSHFEIPVSPPGKGFCVQAKGLPDNKTHKLCAAGLSYMLGATIGFQHIHDLFLRIPQGLENVVAARTRIVVIRNRVLQAMALLRHEKDFATFSSLKMMKFPKSFVRHSSAMVLPRGEAVYDYFTGHFGGSVGSSTFDEYYLPIKKFLLSIPSSGFIFATSDDCVYNNNVPDDYKNRLMALKGLTALVHNNITVAHRGDMWSFQLFTDDATEGWKYKVIVPIVKALKETFQLRYGSNGTQTLVEGTPALVELEGCQTVLLSQSNLEVNNGLNALLGGGLGAIANDFIENQLITDLRDKRIIEASHSHMKIQAFFVKYPVKFLGTHTAEMNPELVVRLTMCTLPYLEEDPAVLATCPLYTTTYILFMPLDPEGCLLRVWKTNPSLHQDATNGSFLFVPQGFYVLMPCTMFYSLGMNTAPEGNLILKLHITLSDRDVNLTLNNGKFFPPFPVPRRGGRDRGGIVLFPAGNIPAVAAEDMDLRNAAALDEPLRSIADLFVH
jgi:hypothetical protein